MRENVKRASWNKTYLHGPMDYAKKLKLRFRVGAPHLFVNSPAAAEGRDDAEDDEPAHGGHHRHATPRVKRFRFVEKR